MKNKVFAYLAMISFIIFSFVLVIDNSCFNKTFYKVEYNRLEVAKDIGISEEDLFNATNVLLDYTKGQRNDMEVYANFNGVKKEVFNEREKLHMVDVRELYLSAKMIGNISMIIFIIAILMLVKDRDIFFHLYRAFNNSLKVLALILAVTIFYIIVDFNGFWLLFHRILFDNDLYFLDPLSSNLINMVPETFFNHLVLLIASMYIIILVMTYLVIRYFRKRDFND